MEIELLFLKFDIESMKSQEFFRIGWAWIYKLILLQFRPVFSVKLKSFNLCLYLPVWV